MDDSLKTGLMAVFAVSGSVVFLAMQAHKRLVSNFMKEMELEMNNSTGNLTEGTKKRVRFADDVVQYEKSNGMGQFRRTAAAGAAAASRNIHGDDDENLEGMPQNWQIMYKGILKQRNLRGCDSEGGGGS